MHNSFIIPYVFQIAGATDKILDELFNSSAGRLVFVVMIIAIVSIPVLLFLFLRILQKSLSNSATQLQKALESSANDRKDLIAVITRLQTYVDKSQEENSENYLMLKTHIEQMLSTLTTVSSAIVANQTASNAATRGIGDLLLQTATLHAETRRDVQTSFRHELETALEQILDQRRLDIFEDFQTPAEDDCRYQIKLIRSAFTPTLPDTPNDSEPRDILLYKAPIFKDGNEAGRLRGSGEVVKIITETVFPGWAYIKQLYGEERVAGYARLKNVSIINLPDMPTIHKESSDEQTK